MSQLQHQQLQRPAHPRRPPLHPPMEQHAVRLHRSFPTHRLLRPPPLHQSDARLPRQPRGGPGRDPLLRPITGGLHLGIQSHGVKLPCWVRTRLPQENAPQRCFHGVLQR